MCIRTVQLSPGVNSIAVNEYTVSYIYILNKIIQVLYFIFCFSIKNKAVTVNKGPLRLHSIFLEVFILTCMRMA